MRIPLPQTFKLQVQQCVTMPSTLGIQVTIVCLMKEYVSKCTEKTSNTQPLA